MSQLGTVLVFNPVLTRAEAEAVVERLFNAGVLDRSYFVDALPPVESFNPAMGGPVWYVP